MGDLKAEAYRYYQQGFNVVAVKYEYGEGKGGKVGKKPLCDWSKWHNQRQTLEEFESQNWNVADAFAVVTDFPNKDGLYLTVVDYDVRGEVTEQAKAKGKELLAKFPATQMEKTVSDGKHLVYLSKVKPRAVKDYHKTHALELIGGGLLCLMAPSKGYERLNDNQPTVIEDAVALFCEILGVEDKRVGVNEGEGLPSSLLEKWLKQILDSGKLKVAGEGSKYYYCHCPLPSHGGSDVHPSFVLHKSKFYGYCFTEDKVLSLKELAEALGVKLEAVKEAEELPIKPCFSQFWKHIHPAIDVTDGVAYIGVNLPCEVKKEGKTEFREFHFLVGSDKSLLLCQKEELNKHRVQLSHVVVRLPNRWSLKSIEAWLNGKASVNPEELYISVKTALETYIEFEDSTVYDFLALWIIGSYFFHLFQSYPYLYIGGMKQVGKTKLLTVLSLLCHNAIFSNNISTASAFRLIQSGRCTLLMDETEKLSNPEREIDFRNMLFAGYKKGALVYRTHKDTLKPEPFEVYSPKALANIKGIEDVLEDRCISIIMKRGKNLNIVNREIPLESEVWQQIRDMLYTFYLSYFNELSELSECSEHGGEALKQRELELWHPILTLARFFDRYFEGLYERMLQFAVKKSNEKLVENLTETFDFLLVQILTSIVVEDGFYKVKAIKDAMASNFDEPQKWLTTKWIGNALRRLGFTEKRRFGSGYEYYLSKDKVLDLAERLGIFKTPSPDSSLSSLHSLSSPLPSIPDVYKALREQFKEPFDEGKAISFIAQLRKCDFEEAKKLFKIFVDEGKLFKDAYGLWMWIKSVNSQNEVSPEPKSEPVREKKLETFHIGENRGIVDNSKVETPKGLIRCEFCFKQGKPMFFATKHDLERHVLAFHSGYPDKPKPDYVR